MAQKKERFAVRHSTGGSRVVDTERASLDVAWCGDACSASASGVVSISGRAEAQRIARLLNDAEAAKGRR